MPGPPQLLEALVGLLIPPACREEVLGDLHEQYTGLAHYVADALSTVPLVILSGIRRTTDFQVLLMEAFVLYLSFWGAAKFEDAAFLNDHLGLLRLAIPAATALVALMLEDAYAMPGKRGSLKAIRAPAFGLGMALVSQAVLSVGNPEVRLPRWILWCGAGTGLLLVGGVRMLFPPLADRPQGASGPVFWLQQASGPMILSPGTLRFVKGAGLIAAAALFGALVGYQPVVRPQVLVLAAVVVVAVYQVRKWKL